MAIRPTQLEPIAPDKLITLQLKAPGLVIPRGSITAAHHIGFATADSTGAGAAQHFQGEELLKTIGP